MDTDSQADDFAIRPLAIVTKTSQNESTLTMNNSLDNQGINQNAVFKVSNEKTMPIIEFTETEKQTMKQIDEINPSGENFIQWLKDAILMQKLIINEPQTLIHTVDDTIFIVTPSIFMRYVMEFPQVQPAAKAEKTPAWRYMQKAFEKLKYHKLTQDVYSIWTCVV